MKVFTDISKVEGIINPVVTTGTFDGVHKGHRHVINHLNNVAREKNGESVLLTFFPHPRMVLFPDDDSLKLINSQSEKIKLLAETGLENLIIYPFTKEFSKLNYVEYVRDVLIETVGTKHLVIGYDHHFGRNREGNYEKLEELAPVYDYTVQEIPAHVVNDVNVSSTKVRKAIQNGKIHLANNYLGYNFHFSGVVRNGKKLGRTIDFPTANIELIDSYKILPKNGVYAVKIYWKDSCYKGMMNIGNKPTVSDEMKQSIEVNIFNFDEDIYDELLKIEVVRHLRDEVKFEGVDSLKAQLEKDKVTALTVL